jgi:hypothetical protein
VHLSEIITLTMLSSKIEIVTFIVLVFELNSEFGHYTASNLIASLLIEPKHILNNYDGCVVFTG